MCGCQLQVTLVNLGLEFVTPGLKGVLAGELATAFYASSSFCLVVHGKYERNIGCEIAFVCGDTGNIGDELWC